MTENIFVELSDSEGLKLLLLREDLIVKKRKSEFLHFEVVAVWLGYPSGMFVKNRFMQSEDPIAYFGVLQDWRKARQMCVEHILSGRQISARDGVPNPGYENDIHGFRFQILYCITKRRYSWLCQLVDYSENPYEIRVSPNCIFFSFNKSMRCRRFTLSFQQTLK